MQRAATVFFVCSMFLLFAIAGCNDESDITGCSRDTDCKGDRVCENGVCVSPADGDLPDGDAVDLDPEDIDSVDGDEADPEPDSTDAVDGDEADPDPEDTDTADGDEADPEPDSTDSVEDVEVDGDDVDPEPDSIETAEDVEFDGDEADPEPDSTDSVEDVEVDEPYVDPCLNTALNSCVEFQSNSCMATLLGCSDFAGRDYSFCHNYYGSGDTAIGRTIYFDGGDYWREFFDSTTFEAGNADGVCYFLQPGRMQNEGEYTDAQGNHIAYMFSGASHTRIECGDTVECYDSTDLMNCDGFPFPPFSFIPQEGHPLICTDVVCDPACDADAGMVCDNGACVEIQGTACTSDDDCATGESCVERELGQHCRICLSSCSAENSACPVGYECIAEAGICSPTVTFQGCPEIEMRNMECKAETAQTDCPLDSICITNSAVEAKYPWGWCAAECRWDTDCAQNSNVDEACIHMGVNVCLARCNEHSDCPENVDCMDPFGIGFNVCSHQSIFFEDGTLALGEPCGGQDRCAFGGMCLGGPTMGYQCRATCDDHHDTFNCSDSQYCKHLASGSDIFTFGYCIDCGQQAPGAACTFGDIHPDAGDCACIDGIGSSCRGIHPDNMNSEQRVACTTVEDCSGVFPHPACVAAADDGQTYCGSSYCAPMCDENDSCDYIASDDYDFSPEDVDGRCYCVATMPGE